MIDSFGPEVLRGAVSSMTCCVLVDAAHSSQNARRSLYGGHMTQDALHHIPSHIPEFSAYVVQGTMYTTAVRL